MINRRQFALGSATIAAFAGFAARATGQEVDEIVNQVPGYGPLMPDPNGFLDLPKGFSYRVIAQFGDRMDDGHRMPDRADGMGCIPLANGTLALVCNHELKPANMAQGPLGDVKSAYDRLYGDKALPGGTTTMIFDPRTGKLAQSYLSLAGTIRNCAGGITPWGSWLSCEETLLKPGAKGAEGIGQSHGWVFEVDAATRGLADPRPITALGRFNHEAAAVDPRTGIIYETEDEDNGLFYRLLPAEPGKLHKGGRLQALGFRDQAKGGDTRNWTASDMTVGKWKEAVWIDLNGTDNPDDALMLRGHGAGAAFFARGEGVHYANGDIFFMCTSGGTAQLGQVFRYRPSRFEGQSGEKDEPGMLELFVESGDKRVMNYGDNITVAPWGHMVVCEDQYTDILHNHLRGITPDGKVYTIAYLRAQTELAGACFSPDGGTLFVNAYSPGKTLAITGPWLGVDVGRV